MAHLLSSYLSYQKQNYPDRAPSIQRVIAIIRQQETKTENAPDRPALLLIEARATKAYWSSLRPLTKQPNDWIRTYPHAQDPLNCALNIGYTMLENLIRERIKKHGLDPAIGMLHEPHDGKEAFVYDLEELFRQPIVDAAIIPSFTRGKAGSLIENKCVVSRILRHMGKPIRYRHQWRTIQTVLDSELQGYLFAIKHQQPWKPYTHSWTHWIKTKRPVKAS
jgi:CRISPR-associated endonuclease Cas1